MIRLTTLVFLPVLFLTVLFSAAPAYAQFSTRTDCELSGCTSCVYESSIRMYSCAATRGAPAPGEVDLGKVDLPAGLAKLGSGPGALVTLLNIILRLLVVVGGLYALLNTIIAGYQFMTAGGDPKQVSSAWARIWQSIVGLILVAGSFLLAAVIGQLLFGDAGAILNPRIFLPE